MKLSVFYNKYPYPNLQIKKVEDLDNLKFQKTLLGHISKYKDSGKALEIGCGTGEMSLLLSNHGYEVTGADISFKSLKIAQKTSNKLNLKTQFKRLDILKTPNNNEVYDITVANGVLHHTQKPYLGFTNMVKLTKKEGIIVLVLYTKIGLITRKIIGKIIPFTLIKLLFPKTKSVLIDAFYHPHETANSKKEILKWFRKKNLKYLEFKNFGNVFMIIGKKK